MNKLSMLKTPKEFKKVYAGKKLYTPHLSFHYTPSCHQEPCTKFGITVSKKTISKKAVDRNRVKRRIREALRLFFNDPPLQGYAIVVTAIKETRLAEWNDYIESVKLASKKILKSCQPSH